MTEHKPVLLRESVDAMVIDKSGLYIDGTFGRGGHSREILSRLNDQGRLLAFDKDPEAVRVGEQLAAEDSRFHIVHGSFATMLTTLDTVSSQTGTQWRGNVSGILLDLGVSSPQLDDASRGFSFMQEGPLDMRMNNREGESAAQWLSRAEANEIAFVLKEYGEERFARRIANAIVEARQTKPLTTTRQLANLIEQSIPKKEKHKHPATRSFQGIRIFINGELEDLTRALEHSLEALKPGGRLAVISFHSLEDRLAKRFMQQQAKGDAPRGLPLRDSEINRRLKLAGKAQKASEKEVESNVRSRSAVLRVAEKLK
ncbi:MAG: 16S rRNA (cytosine(1402)-N(4))-methyltransferase RsmH [Ketobacteraceae bacterium]|nr:16S rRNA (cytosine(1402)-N(4))-methyltransferase RsmH [Ketobacteraceae bacterium]